MNVYSKIFLAAIAGALASAISMTLMGYLAAVTIPKEFFSWFQQSPNLGFVLLTSVQQILAYGLPLLAAGYLVVKRLSLATGPALLSLLAGFWLYTIVGTALIYQAPLQNPFAALSLPMVIMLTIHILFLAAGIALGKRYSQRISAENA
ncbi:hypothetical protein ACNKU7_01905 [Microbulbifer sp. SA54]|uniref:hypothetical protein n=1 Tax=Microbulbifer sp. SA54 TaxID=3401577 RepID=UPI003AAD007A